MPLSIQEKFSNLENLIRERINNEKGSTNPNIINHRTTIHYKDIHGKTLLEYAAEMGDFEAIKKIFNENSDITTDLLKKTFESALKTGHIEIADFLYQLKIPCPEVKFYFDLPTAARDWVTTKLKEEFSLYEEKKLTDLVFINEENLFERIIDLSDLELLIEKTEKIKRLNRTKQNSLIRYSIIHGKDLVFAHLFQEIGFEPQSIREGVLLVIAAEYNRFDIVKHLLSTEIDINAQDRCKKSAIFYAVENNNRVILRELMQKKPNLSLTTINQDNLLHFIKSIEVLEELQNYTELANLVHQPNMYGFTPLNIALQNGRDEIIQFFQKNMDTTLDLDELKKSSEYCHLPVITAQNNVLNKMRYYMQTNYRDSSLFPSEGHCNGFSFKRLLNKENEDNFFDYLALMGNWDGTQQSLEKKVGFKDHISDYKNLGDIFEQWINDIIWFQHSAIKDESNFIQIASEHKDREKQYKLLRNRNNKNNDFVVIYEHPSRSITYDQLYELVSYFSLMSKGSQIEFGGSGHATSCYKKKDNIAYYDPNFKYKATTTNNIAEILRRIIDYKYTCLGMQYPKDITICFSYFTQDISNNLESNSLFTEHFPKSVNDAQLFSQRSFHKFNPLHVAVLIQDIEAVKKILDDQYCDVFGEDILGRTPLAIAIENNFIAAIDLFAEQYEHCRKIALLDAVKKNNFLKVEQFGGDLTLNNQEDSYKTVLLQTAVDLYLKNPQANENIIKYLLAKGLHLLDLDQDRLNSLLKNDLFKNISNFNISLIQENKLGHNLIDYIAENKLNAALQILLDNDHTIVSRNKKILDIVLREEQDLMELDEINALVKCLEVIVPYYHFDLSTEIEQTRYILSIKYLAKSQNSEHFLRLCVEGNRSFLNNISIDNKPLLIYLLVAKTKADLLVKMFELVRDLDINVCSPTTANTPLMMLVHLEKYPEREKIIKAIFEYQGTSIKLDIKNKQGQTLLDLLEEKKDSFSLQFQEFLSKESILPQEFRNKLFNNKQPETTNFADHSQFFLNPSKSNESPKETGNPENSSKLNP